MSRKVEQSWGVTRGSRRRTAPKVWRDSARSLQDDFKEGVRLLLEVELEVR